VPVVLVSPQGGELWRPGRLRVHPALMPPRSSRCRTPGSLQTPAASL
jgi:hypothetical protein